MTTILRFAALSLTLCTGLAANATVTSRTVKEHYDANGKVEAVTKTTRWTRAKQDHRNATYMERQTKYVATKKGDKLVLGQKITEQTTSGSLDGSGATKISNTWRNANSTSKIVATEKDDRAGNVFVHQKTVSSNKAGGGVVANVKATINVGNVTGKSVFTYHDGVVRKEKPDFNSVSTTLKVPMD